MTADPIKKLGDASATLSAVRQALGTIMPMLGPDAASALQSVINRIEGLQRNLFELQGAIFATGGNFPFDPAAAHGISEGIKTALARLATVTDTLLQIQSLTQK